MVRNQKELTKRHAEAFVRRNVQKREYMETTGRFLHVCANCECEESAEWHAAKDTEDEDLRYCYRCTAHYNSYGDYPDEKELRRLADKAARIASYADLHPPPGPCENPNCQQDGSSLWHWNSFHKFYLCDACSYHARDDSDELRIPQRHKRTAAKAGTPCASHMCGDTEACRWAWAASLNARVCNACSKFQKRNGYWPDRLSRRDKRKGER
jgi:hypothetical protein